MTLFQVLFSLQLKSPKCFLKHMKLKYFNQGEDPKK